MPAGWVALTAKRDGHGPTTPTDAAQCNDGHPFVELYRGFSTSEAKRFAAKHNAAVHGISKFGPTSIHSVPTKEADR